VRRRSRSSRHGDARARRYPERELSEHQLKIARINDLERAIHTPIDDESREVLMKLSATDIYVLGHTIRLAYRSGAGLSPKRS